MPLRYTEDPAAVDTVKTASEKYLIFYSSRDVHGKLWCPDCLAVEDIVEKKFSDPTGPSGLIVWVGQRADPYFLHFIDVDNPLIPSWKTPANVFRSGPWNVESIPTIIRVEDGARLVLDEIRDGIASF